MSDSQLTDPGTSVRPRYWVDEREVLACIARVPIDLGRIGLADIQRSFVWANPMVRHLFDAMCRRHRRSCAGELGLRDQLRNMRFIELGWEVGRFWVYEVRDDLDGCVAAVLRWARAAEAAA